MRRRRGEAVPGYGRGAATIRLLASVAVAAALVACSLGTAKSDASARQPAFVTRGPGDPVSASPSPAPKATAITGQPSKKPTKKATARATPSETIPPPPGCAGYRGTNLSKSSVKSLLTAASHWQPWVGVQQPANLTKPLPAITVPLTLLKAVAAQESGWQTACKSNDGLGFGLFQISAATQTFVNQRFGTTYDRFTPSGNVAIATDNLAWLVEYFGQFHFHETYGWSNSDLLNAVIASFNVGYGTVDGDGEITIPDYAWPYVNAVRQQQQPTADCQQWG
jgi:soluble lytic murein transglycosylase-like protein